ncbi:unnamed protein product [Caenorhabditis sp. 36 PRJEB53466]|nr:unnamed protein product [Caenorhabditis sp. 36 PRJEB53466]
MNEKHVLECKSISFMTAISNGTWFSKIYKPPSVFQILKSVSFTAVSGEVHGIVGVADSGKTTLLEALTSGAGGDIGGIAMLDKFMLTHRRFNKYCSHINYRSQYPSALSVRSLLYYHARLCLASSHTSLEIDHRISELTALFDVIGYAHDKLEDLSVSAQRRVMTVLELLKDPILTIIDDPTADLSPLSAYQLVYALHFYAAKFNRIIIITLRNVRSDLSHLLGSATFLFYGEVAYSGPMRLLPTHFKKAGYECPTNENPAAYYLSLLTIDKESMEKVMETQETATKLVTFRAETDSSSNTSGSTITGTGVLLESRRHRPSTSTAFAILFRRMFSLVASTPSASLSALIAIPAVGCAFSFLRSSSLPSSLFFWKLSSFLFLLLQIVIIFPSYSKTRLLSALEVNLYSPSLSLFVFSLFFFAYISLQSFAFTGILLWSFNMNEMLEISLNLLLLSVFSFSIFTISARYLKDCSNILIIQSIVLLLFFVTGNGLTRTSSTSSALYYTGTANPFTYSSFLISQTLSNSTDEDDCTFPINDGDFNEISYVELNKRRRGDGARHEGDKLVNRMNRPKVKKIYVKRNGEDIYEKPKLFVWRQWQSPRLDQLLEDIGPYVGMDDGASAIYTLEGEEITDPDEITDLGTYYVAGDESLMLPETANPRRSSDPDVAYSRMENNQSRYTSLSAPEFYTSNSVRSTYPANIAVPPTPPPRPYTAVQTTKTRKTKTRDVDMSQYDSYYDDALQDAKNRRDANEPKNFDTTMDFFEGNPHSSEFDNEETIRKDKAALEKHRQKQAQRSRRLSTMIFNRRDQTHPDVYLIYVFLNGQGMECQFMNFQRKQLEKGMNYVLELIARRYSVNPGKLVDMDGRKVGEVTQLMSRGAYVLVPVGQSFRDTWYFLPDNAIDTSSNKVMIEERSAQRDRLLQRRLKKDQKTKKTAGRSKSVGAATSAPKIEFSGRNNRR